MRIVSRILLSLILCVTLNSCNLYSDNWNYESAPNSKPDLDDYRPSANSASSFVNLNPWTFEANAKNLNARATRLKLLSRKARYSAAALRLYKGYLAPPLTNDDPDPEISAPAPVHSWARLPPDPPRSFPGPRIEPRARPNPEFQQRPFPGPQFQSRPRSHLGPQFPPQPRLPHHPEFQGRPPTRPELPQRSRPSPEFPHRLPSNPEFQPRSRPPEEFQPKSRPSPEFPPKSPPAYQPAITSTSTIKPVKPTTRTTTTPFPPAPDPIIEPAIEEKQDAENQRSLRRDEKLLSVICPNIKNLPKTTQETYSEVCDSLRDKYEVNPNANAHEVVDLDSALGKDEPGGPSPGQLAAADEYDSVYSELDRMHDKLVADEYYDQDSDQEDYDEAIGLDISSLLYPSKLKVACLVGTVLWWTFSW